MNLIAALLLLSLLLPTLSQAQNGSFESRRIRAVTSADGERFSWNIRIKRGQQSGQVVYVFPPMGQPPSFMTRKAAFKTLISDPSLSVVIISTTLPEPWILTAEMREELVQKLAPKIETDMGLGPDVHRNVIGLSRGGFNAIQILFRNPDFFQSALLMSPFIPSLPFTATDADYEMWARKLAEKSTPDFLKEFNPAAYETNLRDETRQLTMIATIARNIISGVNRGADRWNELEPNAIAQSVPLKPGTRIKVYGNRLDEYGFAEGTERFVSELRKRGHTVSLEMNEEGGHLSEVEDRALANRILQDFFAQDSDSKGAICRRLFN